MRSPPLPHRAVWNLAGRPPLAATRIGLAAAPSRLRPTRRCCSRSSATMARMACTWRGAATGWRGPNSNAGQVVLQPTVGGKLVRDPCLALGPDAPPHGLDHRVEQAPAGRLRATRETC